MNNLTHGQTLIIGYLAASLILGILHRRMSSSGSFFAILYCMPFTAMHESAHFAAALLTGGRPSSFSIWPRRTGDGWVLGSVNFVPTVISAAPTALAPLGWLVVGYHVMVFWDFRPAWVPDYMMVVFLYSCSAACTPSMQDIRVAIRKPFSLLMWVGSAYILWKTLGDL